jgi:hypothetical protein
MDVMQKPKMSRSTHDLSLSQASVTTGFLFPFLARERLLEFGSI